MDLDGRLQALDAELRGLGGVLVAFSGGADSAFLLAAAVRALGPERVVAATAVSPSLAQAELPAAQAFAEGLGVRHLTPGTDEGSLAGYVRNDGDRCYFCKATLADTLLPLATDLGLHHVATGTNADDLVASFRPGIRAAAERGVVTPLRDLTKAEVRATSHRWGLVTADKPALACLASRIAYGISVTPHRPGGGSCGQRVVHGPRAERRQVGAVLLVVVTGLLGAWIGVTLAGGVTRDVGPFTAELTLRPGAPGTVVDIPPLGELRLDTHRGIVGLRAEVLRVDRDKAQALLSDPGRLAALGDAVAADVQAGLRDAAVRTGAAAVVGALLLGGLAWRRPRRVLLAGAVGVAACVVSGGVAAATFDRRAIAEPRFTGLLAYAPSAIGDVRALTDRFGDYSRQLGRLAANVSALYATTSTLPAFEAGTETVRVLHVSDLHLNPAAWDVIRSVVEQFDVDVVVDTGDLTDHGTFAEARFADPISTLGVPYVFARGNHDSSATEGAVRGQTGAVVLDGRTVEVAGIRFLGTGDPRFTPDKTTGDDDAPRDVLLAVGEGLALEAQTGAPPDLVAVHDPVMAEPLHGRVPLVLAGHQHRRSASEEEGTRVLVQGSTGGAGLRALENEEPTPVTLTVLYLDPSTHRLEAYDEITLGGLGSSEARIVRTVVDATDLPSGPDVALDRYGRLG